MVRVIFSLLFLFVLCPAWGQDSALRLHKIEVNTIGYSAPVTGMPVHGFRQENSTAYVVKSEAGWTLLKLAGNDAGKKFNEVWVPDNAVLSQIADIHSSRRTALPEFELNGNNSPQTKPKFEITDYQAKLKARQSRTGPNIGSTGRELYLENYPAFRANLKNEKWIEAYGELSLSADLGFSYAMYEVGKLYINGLKNELPYSDDVFEKYGVNPPSSYKGLPSYERIALIELGLMWLNSASREYNPLALNKMGELFYTGITVIGPVNSYSILPQDKEKAFEYFYKAAERGSYSAKMNLLKKFDYSWKYPEDPINQSMHDDLELMKVWMDFRNIPDSGEYVDCKNGKSMDLSGDLYDGPDFKTVTRRGSKFRSCVIDFTEDGVRLFSPDGKPLWSKTTIQ